MKQRNNLNIPFNFIKHMNADDNYGYENFRLQMSDKHVFSLYADDGCGKNNITLIRYDYEFGWIYSLETPILKETLDLFIDLCKTYYDLGDNILMLTEYGIMEE